MKKLFLKAIILSQFFIPAYAETAETFNLAGVIENIINYQTHSDFAPDIRLDSKDNFLYAMQNMTNGNVVVAYSEFEKTVNSLDKNISLFMLAKKLYEFGLFDLADIALNKISNVEKIQSRIKLLKEAYEPSYKLSREEETYLAKAYTSIFYNNSPEEAAFNLVKKTGLMENSDYANYIMAMCMFECKQYNQALNYINRAIEKNNINSNYKIFKARVLTKKNQPKEALKYITEIEDMISVYFVNDLKILKQNACLALANDEADKKFHQIYIYYLEGNYYKVLKETQNILTFNKNNPKILTLQGMAHLALSETKQAEEDFNQSYKLDKKFELTLMGLADIDFINGNYAEAISMYKKLFKSPYKKEAIIKTAAIYEVRGVSDKKAEKIEKLKNSVEQNAYFEYYQLANSIFANDDENRKKYVMKSLNLNMLNVDTWDILLSTAFKSNDFTHLNKLVFMLSFLDLKNPEYYYYSALCLDNSGKKRDAFYEVKKAVLVNPDYKPAQELITKLESELI